MPDLIDYLREQMDAKAFRLRVMRQTGIHYAPGQPGRTFYGGWRFWCPNCGIYEWCGSQANGMDVARAHCEARRTE